MPAEKKRAPWKKVRVANVAIGRWGQSTLLFIAEESVTYGRDSYFRLWDGSGNQEIKLWTDHMKIEDLGALTNQLNIEFSRRLEKLKQESGF